MLPLPPHTSHTVRGAPMAHRMSPENHCYHDSNKCGQKKFIITCVKGAPQTKIVRKSKAFCPPAVASDIMNQGAGRQETNYSDFHYFLWGKMTWYSMKLVYNVTSGTNKRRLPRYHCIGIKYNIRLRIIVAPELLNDYAAFCLKVCHSHHVLDGQRLQVFIGHTGVQP